MSAFSFLSRTGRLNRETMRALLAVLLSTGVLQAAVFERQPAPDDPAQHSFPAAGTVATRKVPVEWNRHYDHAGLGAILAQLHQAFPGLTKLYSIGKSTEGRDLWCLEVTAFDQGDARRKPAMYIEANIHGNEVQGGEVVAYTAWYLCHQYGQLEKVTELMNRCVFYLVPTINPDARDHFFNAKGNASWPRSGLKPHDDDQDGVADEDDYDDLDGDGNICQMRIRDPNGRWKRHPDCPELLMIPCKENERGEFTLLGQEGIDNDGDGRVNEDPVGGYDMNRDWGWDWQPRYIQHGAMNYPFNLPETRAVAEFILDHANIAAAQSYHNAMGAILRSPGREGGNIQAADDALLQQIGARGERIVPFYRSLNTAKDLYTVWGGNSDWLYSARGILNFVNELWTAKNLYRDTNVVSAEAEAEFIKHVLLNDAAVKWHEYEHPTYGRIEIGGTKKNWGRTPPSFLLEEECHRNMAFTLYNADQMPLLRIADVQSDKLADGLYRVWVTIENQRIVPTRCAQDVRQKINPPDMVSLAGPDVKVLSSGLVLDRYFKRAQAVKRRPERVEVDAIPGMGAVRVQFIVRGSGRFTVTVDSAKGGWLSAEQGLP